jgi:hypothetical protein
MAAAVHRRAWLWTAAVAAAVIVGGVLLTAAVTGAPSRGAVFTMLQRPAVVKAASPAAAVSATHGAAAVEIGAVRYAVRLAPNRASVPNRLTISAGAARRPLVGAQVTVTFSMPAMGMWHVFSLVLHPAGPGRYAAVMPFVGMPGAWRLDARVTRPGLRASAFAIADALQS